MNALLVYMFKAALYLAAFYLIYSVLLSRDTSYGRNRGFIIMSLIAAFILPVINMHAGPHFNSGLFGKWMSEVIVTGDSAGNSESASEFKPSLFRIINTIYFSGMVIFLAKLLFDLSNLLFLIIKQRNDGSRIIRYHVFNTSGFSAMGYIFVNSGLTGDEETEIIRHEQNHLHKNHFLDIIVMELVKSFQWFNPAVYMFNRSLRAVHEYQADQECLRAGATVTAYQNLLLKQVFRTGSLNLSNSFSNPSLIKKRMIMMTKEPTSSIAGAKLLIVIPVIGILFLFVSAFGKTPSLNVSDGTVAVSDSIAGKNETMPYVQVEEMPLFPGGDEALLKYIGQNTIYPVKAKKNNIEGRVIIRFCVNDDGSVNRIAIIKGVDPELDAEAIRVASTLPKFTPGRQGGKAVPVWYMVPITFTLK